MTELVELQQIILHAVIFKMGGDDVAVRVIGGVLHGAEVRDVHILRDDDKAAGVLTRGALYADKPLRETVFLRLGGGDAALLKVLFDIAVGRLFRESADGAGAENMVGAKQHLGIFMRLRLIFAGEVQVDIGCFFVAGVAEEGFKGDIEAVSAKHRAALRAVFLRHIRAAAVAVVGNKLAVLALRADIVRREGVYLGDAGHIRNDGRADTATAADKIAVLKGVLHKLLRRHIDNVIMVAEDGVKLRIDTLLHDARRIFAVDAVHFAVDKVAELFGGIFDFRGEQLLRKKLYLLHHVRDGAGIGDDDLLRRLLAEIGKLRQHLLGISEVDGAASVRVAELLCCLKNMAVLLVLGVEEVYVRGGDDGLIELSAKRKDRAVIVLEDGHVLDDAVIHQKAVIADGLDFKIVIERGYLLKLLI